MMRVARTSHRILELRVVSNEFIGESFFVGACMAMRRTVFLSLILLSFNRFFAPFSQRVARHARLVEQAFLWIPIEAKKKASRAVANKFDATKKIFDFFEWTTSLVVQIAAVGLGSYSSQATRTALR